MVVVVVVVVGGLVGARRSERVERVVAVGGAKNPLVS